MKFGPVQQFAVFALVLVSATTGLAFAFAMFIAGSTLIIGELHNA